jgi:hypothetical protein
MRNPVRKNQFDVRQPIHQKYKPKESTGRHNLRKNKSEQFLKKRKKSYVNRTLGCEMMVNMMVNNNKEDLRQESYCLPQVG